MIRRALVAVSLLVPTLAPAAPLDDAIALVQRAYPVLQSQEAVYREATRQRDWSTDLTLGWTERGTAEGGAAGPNAGIRVSIPLFDRSHELRSAEARSAWLSARESVLAAFLAAVTGLEELALATREADTMSDFWRDRLEYQQRQVEEGIVEPDTLWPVAESMQRAEILHGQKQQALASRQEAIAREYGGQQWMTLRDLLAEHVKPSRP